MKPNTLRAKFAERCLTNKARFEAYAQDASVTSASRQFWKTEAQKEERRAKNILSEMKGR